MGDISSLAWLFVSSGFGRSELVSMQFGYQLWLISVRIIADAKVLIFKDKLYNIAIYHTKWVIDTRQAIVSATWETSALHDTANASIRRHHHASTRASSATFPRPSALNPAPVTVGINRGIPKAVPPLVQSAAPRPSPSQQSPVI